MKGTAVIATSSDTAVADMELVRVFNTTSSSLRTMPDAT